MFAAGCKRRATRLCGEEWLQRPLGGRSRFAAKSSSSRFAFVNELASDRERLVQMSKQALQDLGRSDDHVKLLLPPLPSRSASDSATGITELDQVATIEVHNPSARNALTGRMMAQLAEIVTRLEDPTVHRDLSAIVMRGSGGWFCAGADLRVAKDDMSTREAGTAMGALMTDTLTRFRRLPLVSVALVEGGAFGGGAELCTACDFRVVADNAVIQFVQSRMGVSPGWGGGARLYKIVGRQTALRLLCTAEKLTSNRALDARLADAVFKTDRTDSPERAIFEFVQPFANVAPEVSHGAKHVVSNADDVSLDEVLEFEHQVFATLWGGPANLKALQNALPTKSPSS